jgi:predicted amidohydrolase
MTDNNLLRTFAIQFPISSDVLENERAMLSLLVDIPPRSLVVFPEGALSGYSEHARFVDLIDRRVLETALARLKEAAMSMQIHLCFGTCLHEGGRWYNTAIYFGPASEEFIYRKVNLATNERGVFSAGSDLSCFDLMHDGERIRVAFQLCREIRFPEQWSLLARRGARIFIYATNAVGDETQADVWRSHLISRAAENQRFVVCANLAALAQKCPSMIIDPRGRVLWEVLSPKTQTGSVDIDVTRTSNWYLGQSRRDVPGLG